MPLACARFANNRPQDRKRLAASQNQPLALMPQCPGQRRKPLPQVPTRGGTNGCGLRIKHE
jgi:hypothetical protein